MIKNILLTSAGRRVSLVRIFQETLRKYNTHGKVLVTELKPELSSAAYIADGWIKTPKVTEDGYIDFLLEQCKKNDISIVVPTIDTELHILAAAKERFEKENIMLAISSLEICETFYLKSKTETFFKKLGFLTPIIIDDFEQASYPLFAKLDNSSCSIGARKVMSKEDAIELKKQNPNYIFQEFISGKEFTVDAYFDRDSNLICAIPRERIEVRAGEISKGITRKDGAIMNEIKKLAQVLKGVFGCITIQLFKTNDNKIVFIEMNPRFGGGYPLSFYAGANYAELLIKEFFGEKLTYFEDWKENLLMLRYDAEVIVDGDSI